MLETISETKSFKAPLPPRERKLQIMNPVQTKSAKQGSYGDDQDPSFTDGMEDYAKAYYALQSRKSVEQMSPKAGNSPSSITSSDQSEAFVCDMSAASEPLYGDPGEEESYHY